MASGFNFGGTGGTTGTGGGFAFGQTTSAPTLRVPSLAPAATPAGGLGFNLKTTASTGGLGGFNFATQATKTSAAGGMGFGLGGLGGATTTTASGGLALGGAPTTTTASTGFSFGLTPASGAATTTAATGLTLGGAAPTTSIATGGLGGFGLGTGATTAGLTTGATGGLTLGGAPTTTTASTGFSFGLTPASGTATTTAATGLTLGGAAPTTSTGGLGGLGFGVTSCAPTLGLGGLGVATTTPASSIFSKTTSAPTFTGLGGADPKTSSAGAAGGLGSGSDGKTVKETYIPNELVTTVDELQKYVKGEKTVREDIVRMSSKPMMRVQEDTAALKQLLSVVSNGLQRNACTLDKLKMEMTQELKNAEMAQRTKDIPPGLQYENTAPHEYFEQMVEQFEGRMVSYRQQIEMLENHLSALHQPVRHSPSEVFTLIKRLHESFIALAASLQQVHEAIKAQKEQFATHRRVFHGDTNDIFQQATPPMTRPVQRRLTDTAGPTPFPGVTNAAAAAMAAVLNRSQQPAGPPVTGLLGSGAVTGTSWLGAGAGLGATGGLLGGTSMLGQPGQGFPSFSLGAGTAPGITAAAAGFPSGGSSTLASTLGALNNTANASFNMSAATKQPFTLQKPPPGAKRGKR